MRRPRRSNLTAYALFANAVALAVIAVVWIGRDSGSRWSVPENLAMAQVQHPIAGGAGLFLMPAQFGESRWGCYVMDVDTQTLVAYEYTPGNRSLRLVAARNFRYDRQLENHNTFPAPAEIKAMLEKEQATDRANPPAAQPPPAPTAPTEQQPKQ
jgi:hypothetical protein